MVTRTRSVNFSRGITTSNKNKGYVTSTPANFQKESNAVFGDHITAKNSGILGHEGPLHQACDVGHMPDEGVVGGPKTQLFFAVM